MFTKCSESRETRGSSGSEAKIKNAFDTRRDSNEREEKRVAGEKVGRNNRNLRAAVKRRIMSDPLIK